MKKLHPKHIWLIFAAYGVWFAMFSGVEELFRGKYWKVAASLLLGFTIYYLIENKQKKD